VRGERGIVGRRGRRLRSPDDGGFTLVETLVSIAVIGTVMTATSSFLTTSMAVTSAQGNRRTAVQVADHALARVRAVEPAKVLDGRALGVADTSPAPGADAYLDGTEEWNALGAGTLALPLAPETLTLDGIAYDQHWFVGRCWQQRGGGGDECGLSGEVELVRVVVAVTWSQQACPAARCTYLTATLVSAAAAEPFFNANEESLPPAIDNPDLSGEVAAALSAQLTANDPGPLVWGAAGLPPGLTITPATGVVSGTPTTAGPFTVTVTATNQFNKQGSASFTWTIVAATRVTPPGDQSTGQGAPVSLTMSAVNGTPPFGWTATGLPAGLAIDPSTGLISGSPTTAGSGSVTVTATSAAGGTHSVTFLWTVVPPTVQAPAAQASDQGVAISPFALAVSGGTPPYTWSASGLPLGLSIHPATGVISGTPTLIGVTTVTVTARGANGITADASFTWTVGLPPTITLPLNAVPRSNVRNTVFAGLQATRVGGVAPFTWTASDLPAGITISSSGMISGTFTAGTRYISTVRVTDAVGGTHAVTFVWSVPHAVATNLRVTAPAADVTTNGTNTNVINLTPAGGAAGVKTWTVTAGLPAGATYRSTPTPARITQGTAVAGTYTITANVRDTSGSTATVMFVWRITA
jgi:prepilin-type N-terminal cleavage/methylation domain-containing protein